MIIFLNSNIRTKIFRLVFLFLSCCWGSNAICQPTGFSKLLDTGTQCVFTGLVAHENVLIAQGIVRYSNGGSQDAFFARIDTLGNVLDWVVLQDTNQFSPSAFPCLALSSDGQHLMTALNHLQGGGVAVIILDASLHVLYQNDIQVPDGSLVLPYKVVPSIGDEAYLMTGVSVLANFPRAFVAGISVTGELLWYKTYSEGLLKKSSAYSIVQSESLIYLGGTSDGKAHIQKLNREGVLLDKWSSALDKDQVALGLSVDEEGIFTYCGRADKVVNTQNGQVTMTAPMFTRGRFLEDDTLYSQVILDYAPAREVFDMISGMNKDYLIVGGRAFLADTVLQAPQASVYGNVLLLSEEGAVIWEVADVGFNNGEDASLSQLYCITQANTGSIYAAGVDSHRDDFGEFRSYAWLVKITSDGCVDTLCMTTAIEPVVELKKQVIVYPNPARDFLVCQIDPSMNGHYTFELRDVLGRVVLVHPDVQSEIRIDLPHHIAPGTYIWRVFDARTTVAMDRTLIIH